MSAEFAMNPRKLGNFCIDRLEAGVLSVFQVPKLDNRTGVRALAFE